MFVLMLQDEYGLNYTLVIVISLAAGLSITILLSTPKLETHTMNQ